MAVVAFLLVRGIGKPPAVRSVLLDDSGGSWSVLSSLLRAPWPDLLSPCRKSRKWESVILGGELNRAPAFPLSSQFYEEAYDMLCGPRPPARSKTGNISF